MHKHGGNSLLLHMHIILRTREFRAQRISLTVHVYLAYMIGQVHDRYPIIRPTKSNYNTDITSAGNNGVRV